MKIIEYKNYACAECGYGLFRTDSESATLSCVNSNCKNFNIQVKLPARVEVEVEVVEGE